MQWRLWIKRILAFTLASICISFAWHVYKNEYGQPTEAQKEIQRLKEEQRRRLARGPMPSTRPTTRSARKPVFARAEPPASTEPVEREGRDLYHPQDPGNPFRMARAKRHIDGPTDTVRAVAISADKTRLVVGGNDRIVRLFDFATGKQIRSFEGHTAFVRGVDISADGSRIISCGEDHTIRVWDVESGEQFALLEEHQDEVIGVYFLTGNQAVSASHDGTARIWDIDKETTVKKIDYGRRVCAMTVCGPQNLLALGTHTGVVYLWDLKTRTQIHQYETERTCIRNLMLSDDGKKIVICPFDRRFRVVEVQSGKLLFQEPEEEWESIYDAALTADGQTLALSHGFQIIFYNLQTFTRCKTYLNPNAFAHAMCFVPDGPVFISAGGGLLKKDGEWMRPWDDTILIWTLPRPLP